MIKPKIIIHKDSKYTLKNLQWKEAAEGITAAVAREELKTDLKNVNVEYKNSTQEIPKWTFILEIVSGDKDYFVHVLTNSINDEGKKGGRNTWVSQPFHAFLNTIINFDPKAKNYFYKTRNDKNQVVGPVTESGLFVLSNIKNLFSKGFNLGKYKIGIENNNWSLNTVTDKLEEISDLDDFVDKRNSIKDKKGNTNSGYLLSPEEFDETTYTLLAKTKGANRGETELVITSVLNLLLRDSNKKIKEIKYYSFLDDEPEKAIKHISEFKKTFDIDELIVEKDDYNATFKKLVREEFARVKSNKEETKKVRGYKQVVFAANIFKKFNSHVCYLCDWGVPFVVASHIQRYADIENNKLYSPEEKVRRQVSGDNGFYLCAIHDKMFELGFLFVDTETKTFKIDKRTPSVMAESIEKSITKKMSIPDKYMTKDTIEFCDIHRKRLNSN